ncbi:Acyl-CoA dehydrogenase family member 11 [Venturia nashicola]|uniref:Acyl-CoA dehydrogenase family member 11 n=1 Tax=Venturia nashicola TaxID=86259 RepID=A0A4Z1P6V7_9PEZI|nr:Acyl-CoA dehydrogenase family member 11 [Venturia nashicola]TLD23687.1 Acyl-CoA dehydrogenase family member 11 [Venturia nashicola]
MSQGYFGKREKTYIEDLYWGLITCSHILHRRGVFDAYGHISVRNPDNHDAFYMSRNLPPALMQSADDIVEYKLEDAEPMEKDAPKGFAERCIHSEIYKKFPDVNAVVHAHATEVLPFTISGVPLKAPIHMAGFLGTEVPVWDISSAYASKDRHDLLVTTTALGHNLAAAFKPATSSGFLYQKMRSALPTTIGGTNADPSTTPEHNVVLMRGHGFTTLADSLEAVTFQAIYTVEAAKVQSQAILMQNAYFGSVVEGKVDVEAGGKIKSAKVKGEGEIKYLSDRETADAWVFNKETVMRPWQLWCREVEISPLYRIDVKMAEENKR